MVGASITAGLDKTMGWVECPREERVYKLALTGTYVAESTRKLGRWLANKAARQSLVYELVRFTPLSIVKARSNVASSFRREKSEFAPNVYCHFYDRRRKVGHNFK